MIVLFRGLHAEKNTKQIANQCTREKILRELCKTEHECLMFAVKLVYG